VNDSHTECPRPPVDGRGREPSVRELLDQIVAGTATAAKVAPEIARICRETVRKQGAELEGMTRRDIVFARMTGSLEERDDTNTFVEVEAAYIEGRISNEQFTVLHRVWSEAPKC